MMFLRTKPRGRVRVHLKDETSFDGVVTRQGRDWLQLEAVELVRADAGNVPMRQTWIPVRQVRCIELVGAS